MENFTVIKRINNGHDTYVGKIIAVNSKLAFKFAVQEFFDFNKYKYYKAFYVISYNKQLKGFDASYGYDTYGQKGSTASGFRSSLKSIIDMQQNSD